ncbi:MAG: hypothetical protein GXO19_06670, partial [Epsilonproteobacteria bacterium]|nr:hypothetical protein [Campylobacterota bacterium]NPA57400.1 hypothetical protein [Campylobacterota bacterium]
MKRVLSVLLLFLVTMAFGVTREQAQHRLPPVISELNLPQPLKAGPNTFKWAVTGYHDNYRMQIVIYNSYKIPIAHARVDPYWVGNGIYHYGSVRSKLFKFKATIDIDPSKLTPAAYVRFFISPPNDPIDTTFVSCIIPGGFNYEYVGTEGRILKLKAGKSDYTYMDLPFRGAWMVIEGNNGSISHYNHGDWDHTYAIDFYMPEGVEVLAPIKGVVACVYDENNDGGVCRSRTGGRKGCLKEGGRVVVIETINGENITFL